METEDTFHTKIDIFIPSNFAKILACMAIVAICIWSMIEGFAKSEIVGAVKDLRSEMVNSDIRVINLGLIEKDGSINLIGKLRNESQYKYIIATIAIELKNDKNKTVEKLEPYMRKISPGDFWFINENVNAKDACIVEITKFYGTRDMSKK